MFEGDEYANQGNFRVDLMQLQSTLIQEKSGHSSKGGQ